MNVYAHADREAKPNSAKLLDNVVGNDWQPTKMFSLVNARQGKNKGKRYIT